jgi:hypothetical protein
VGCAPREPPAGYHSLIIHRGRDDSEAGITFVGTRDSNRHDDQCSSKTCGVPDSERDGDHLCARPAQLGELYETHQFGSLSVGFIAPGDPSTAVCMAYDTTLKLEGIPERIQRTKHVSANEDVTFARLENGPHHDGVRFSLAPLELASFGGGAFAIFLSRFSKGASSSSHPVVRAASLNFRDSLACTRQKKARPMGQAFPPFRLTIFPLVRPKSDWKSDILSVAILRRLKGRLE